MTQLKAASPRNRSDAGAILAQINELGIVVTTPDGLSIRLHGPQHLITPEVVAAVREHKAAILERLRLDVIPTTPDEDERHLAAICGAHNDPTKWVTDEAAGRPGWFRSTCAACGKFLGYGPGGR